jgi:hypothetical protein
MQKHTKYCARAQTQKKTHTKLGSKDQTDRHKQAEKEGDRQTGLWYVPTRDYNFSNYVCKRIYILVPRPRENQTATFDFTSF